MGYIPTLKDRVKGHLTLARVSNSPTVVSNVFAGAALAGVAWHPSIVPVAVAMVLFYTAGMYLNDVCDYALDCLARPERPLPLGIVTRTGAFVVAVLLLAVGSGLLLGVSGTVLLSGLVLVGFIVVYDLWHKENSLGPVLMACNRALVYTIAYLAFASEVRGPLLWVIGMALVYVIGLTAVAKHETKRTITQRWPIFFLLVPATYFAWQIPWGWIWSLVPLFAAWTVWSISRVNRGQTAAGIMQLIAGISLFDALVLASLQATFLLLVALVAFGLTLLLQRFVKGI